MSSRNLVSSEGVDEGSAPATSEGLGDPVPGRPDVTQEVSAASPGPHSARTPEQPTTVEGGGDDVLGEPPRGAPRDDAQQAEPVDMESEESRTARAERGTGQQYQVGEG